MSTQQFLSYVKTVMGICHGSRAFGGPLQVRLGLTNRCNIRCLHCYFYSPLLDRPLLYHVRRARLTGAEIPDRESLRRQQRVDMDAGRLYPVLEEILSMGTRRFEITGRGEPFVHPKILEIIRILKRAGCYCQVNTNGTLLRRGTLDALIQVKFDELRITTMGGSAEVYQRTHPMAPAGTFDQLRQRLKYVADQKMRYGLRHPRIILAMIVISQNVDGLNDFAKFSSEMGAEGVLFRPVDDVGDAGLARLVPSPRQQMEIRKKLPQIGDFLEAKGIEHNVDYFLKVFNRQLDTRRLYQAIPCYYGWLDPEIDPSGLVYPCCRCYQIMGDAFQNGFASIWNNDAYRRFRHRAKRIYKGLGYPDLSTCGSCVNYTANLKVFRHLHPIRSRTSRMRRLIESV